MKAKKSLGQNFLKSEIALRKIVEAGEISKQDIILEIGPGKGVLTQRLLEHANKIIAVEKDNELFEFLKIKFAEEIKEEKLILINEDILKFDTGFISSNFFSLRTAKPNSSLEKIEEIASSEAILSFSNGLAGVGDPENRGLEKNLKLRSYKIIANIPYNITGAILKKFLTEKNQPEIMVLMVQHEVAQRIMGANSTSPRLRRARESILSISVKAYGKPKMIMKVDKRYFSPRPKVNSAVIKINNISRKIFKENNLNEDKFWEIVKKGFAHKRKKLSSNLKTLPSYIRNSDIDALGNKRAEELSLADWINLAKSININKKK